MSALLREADIAEDDCHVRFVPKADISQPLQVVVFPARSMK